MAAKQPDILQTKAAAAARFRPVVSFLRAALMRGQSPLRLAWRLYQSRQSPQEMTTEEFFRYGMHRPELTNRQCSAFLGRTAVTKFNKLLNGPRSKNETSILNDKLQTAAVLSAAGIPVARVRAIYPSGLTDDTTEVLTSAEEITAFLTRPSSTPCFGKPVFGALSRGVVAIERALDNGLLLLGDGRVVAAAQLAAEIVADYGRGYMFQDLLRASDAIRPLSGAVSPTLRIYSLWVSGDAHLVYATLRLPAPGAMSDDGAIKGSVRLHLDMMTGAVLRAQDMAGFSGATVYTAPVTGHDLREAKVPDWDEVLALATKVHRQFSRHRSLGIDIAMSHQGLIVNEANALPQHLTYQMVSMEGILNPRFSQLFRQVMAERGVKRPKPDVPWPRN